MLVQTHRDERVERAVLELSLCDRRVRRLHRNSQPRALRNKRAEHQAHLLAKFVSWYAYAHGKRWSGGCVCSGLGKRLLRIEVLELDKCIELRTRRLIESPAYGRRSGTAVGSLEDVLAESVFELVNRLGNGLNRNSAGLCGNRKATRFKHGNKIANLLDIHIERSFRAP